MKGLCLMVVAFAAATFSPTISYAADPWPSGSKSIRMVVPFPPGGAPDITARLIADHLGKKTGRTFIVENKPGASGAVGAQEVARAAPDGSTLLLTINSFFSITPHFFKLAIDPNKDLTPISETARNSLVLVGNPKLGPKTLPELITYVKGKPGQISIASPSHGTLFHVAALLLNDLAGLDMNHVAYKGSPQAQNDVIAGHIPFLFDALVGAAENIAAGNTVGFAVNGGLEQSETLGIPTFRQLGYPDMEMLAPWILVAGPPNMSDELTKNISDQITEAIRSEGYLHKMKQLRSSPAKTTSPGELKADLKAEVDRLAVFLRNKGIKQQD